MLTLQAVNMEGVATFVDDPNEAQKQRENYIAKYPFLADAPPNPDMIVMKIIPVKVTFVDNAKGFGHTEEISY